MASLIARLCLMLAICLINEYFSRHCSLFSLKYTVVRSLRTELFEGLWSRGLPAVGREHTETCEGELGSVGGGEMMIFALSMCRLRTPADR